MPFLIFLSCLLVCLSACGKGVLKLAAAHSYKRDGSPKGNKRPRQRLSLSPSRSLSAGRRACLTQPEEEGRRETHTYMVFGSNRAAGPAPPAGGCGGGSGGGGGAEQEGQDKRESGSGVKQRGGRGIKSSSPPGHGGGRAGPREGEQERVTDRQRERSWGARIPPKSPSPQAFFRVASLSLSPASLPVSVNISV